MNYADVDLTAEQEEAIEDLQAERRAELVAYRREFGGTAYQRRNSETKWMLWEMRQRRGTR